MSKRITVEMSIFIQKEWPYSVKFAAIWGGAEIVSWIVLFFAMVALPTMLSGFSGNDSPKIVSFLYIVVSISIVGFCRGIAQEFILTFTYAKNYLRVSTWTILTTLGYLSTYLAMGFVGSLAEQLLLNLSEYIRLGIVFFIAGLVLGFAQWFILRQIVFRAYLWVLSQGVFWSSLWLWVGFYDLVYPPKKPVVEEWVPWLWFTFVLIYLGVGLVMAYLLRHPKPQLTALEAA